MQLYSGDRRNLHQTPSFPLVDSNGSQVTHERRCGKDRRKKYRNDIAENIINILR